MWFYPYLSVRATNGKPEFGIDNVRVCQMTTAAPTSVPATDASGVLVDTPAPATLASATIAPETGAPLDACESSLLSNPSFDTLNGSSSNRFSGGNVVGWAASHGRPYLAEGFHGNYSASMSSSKGWSSGIVTNASFTSGVQYRVTMWVQTKNRNGNIYVRIANGVPYGTASTSFPSVSSAQTVYTNNSYILTAQEITFDFTANTSYTQMWFYPVVSSAASTTDLTSFSIDNVRVCEMTTAAPTSVPVTDASGVIVDTPAPATVAPPTTVPAPPAPATTAPETGAPVPACESSLLSNPSFDTLKDPSFGNSLTLNSASSHGFSGGDVVGWAASHGTPSLMTGFHGADSAWMWSYSGKGDGLVTNASFTSGVQYRVTMWVQTKNPNGNIYVRIANGVPYGTTTSTTFPSVSSAQTVYTSTLVFTTAQEITFDFTANANYAQMWFYPYLSALATNGYADFSIDNVRVCEMTTAAPTSVPVTDASGVIVDTPAPATIAPPTPVPASLSPPTLAPETGAPLPACESSLLSNPSLDTVNGARFNNFSGGNVVGWAQSHGTPSLLTGFHGAYSAWMWSYSGKGDGIVTNASFTSGVQYRVTMWVQTKNPDGNIYVRIANGVPSGTTSSREFPSVWSVQTVYTNTLVFTTAQEITFDFTANANYAQMWFYPLLTGPATNGSANFGVDNIRVCEMTTAAPTSVPVTDASGVIVDTPAPATLAPATILPEATPAPVAACKSSLLTNPSLDTLKDPSSNSFYGGNVVGWVGSHGIPTLRGGFHGAHSAWMASREGRGSGIVTNASFTSGVQYRVTMWVQTHGPTGTINVRIGNGVPSGTTTSTTFPSVSSAQTVYTNALVFTTAQEITFDFTANANYAQMWFYPYHSSWNNPYKQAEFGIDNVRVCQMTTAAPTSVPVTDASGVIVDTPAPATIAPPTPVPATPAPETRAPATKAPTPETSTPSVPTTNAPLTVEDVDWCDVDADCRTYDDSAATCVESKCVCTESEGFVNPVFKKTKETLFICVQPTKRGHVKLRLEWNVDCEQSNGAIEGAVRTAIEETTKGRTDTLVVSCGSTIFVVDVEDADITTVATEDMSELIVTSLKKNEAAMAAGFATPMTVGSSLVPTLKCSAAGATEMVLVNGGCVALACESGYLLSSGSCVEDDDSDDTLSTGAIVGIVLGCTAFVVMIIAVAAFFLCKGSKAEDTVCHPPHHTSTHCRPQLSSQKPTEPAFENKGTVNGAV